MLLVQKTKSVIGQYLLHFTMYMYFLLCVIVTYVSFSLISVRIPDVKTAGKNYSRVSGVHF